MTCSVLCCSLGTAEYMEHSLEAFFAQAGCYLRAAFPNTPDEHNARKGYTVHMVRGWFGVTLRYTFQRLGISYALIAPYMYIQERGLYKLPYALRCTWHRRGATYAGHFAMLEQSAQVNLHLYNFFGGAAHAETSA